MPAFSIVVPAYNASATLRETLDAVLTQEYADWECVVVDDGSTDDTLVIAREYEVRDPRVRVLTQANRGSAGAYDTGVASAVGEHVTICSSDDLLLPAHLRSMAAFMSASPGYDIYSCNGFYLQQDGSRVLVYEQPEWAAERSLDLAAVLHLCFFSVGATYRRSLFDEVGGYRPDVYGEDYDFWLRAMARGAKHRYTPQPLAVHRLSSGQKSAALVRVAESNIKIIEDLIATGLLGDEDLAAARRSIDEQRAMLATERQSQGLRAVVTRVVGPDRADGALDAIHKVTRFTHPARKALNRLAASARGALHRR